MADVSVLNNLVAFVRAVLARLNDAITAPGSSPAVAAGINVNPNAVHGIPADLSTLKGVGQVRLVFQVDSARRDLAAAFAQYDPLVTALNALGIGALFIVNQETVWANGPWMPGSDGNWDSYSAAVDKVAAQIAVHYKGKQVAYQFGNENDVSGAPTSIYIAPETYARLLAGFVRAVKTATPDALTITCGVAGQDPIGYLRAVERAAGTIPADAVALHAYGQRTPNLAPTAPGNWVGNLADYLNSAIQAFPTKPIWITETGMPGVQDYATVAQYLQGVFALVQANFARHVPIVFWFAYSDSMDNAGIVAGDGQPKPYIYDKFLEMAHHR